MSLPITNCHFTYFQRTHSATMLGNSDSAVSGRQQTHKAHHQLNNQHGSGNSSLYCHILGDCGLCVLPQLHKKLSQMEIRPGSSLVEAIISIRKHGRHLHAKEILLWWNSGCNWPTKRTTVHSHSLLISDSKVKLLYNVLPDLALHLICLNRYS